MDFLETHLGSIWKSRIGTHPLAGPGPPWQRHPVCDARCRRRFKGNTRILVKRRRISGDASRLRPVVVFAVHASLPVGCRRWSLGFDKDLVQQTKNRGLGIAAFVFSGGACLDRDGDHALGQRGRSDLARGFAGFEIPPGNRFEAKGSCDNSIRISSLLLLFQTTI